MTFQGPEFVLAIIAVSTIGWLINNWIRARHGYALEDEWGGKTVRPEAEAQKLLTQENSELREQLGKALDRIGVLERIVTDKGYTVAAQIEALREPAIAQARKEH